MATADRIKKLKDKYDEYPDDIFAHTRMSFGDHIEELRSRMIKAIKWLMFFMFIGFILDGIGQSVGNDNIGIGRPMLKIITEPVETQVRDFYYRRQEKLKEEKLANMPKTDAEEIRRIREKLKEKGNNPSGLTAEEREKLMGAPRTLPMIVKTKPLAEAMGIPPGQVKAEEVQIDAEVVPAQIS